MHCRDGSAGGWGHQRVHLDTGKRGMGGHHRGAPAPIWLLKVIPWNRSYADQEQTCFHSVQLFTQTCGGEFLWGSRLSARRSLRRRSPTASVARCRTAGSRHWCVPLPVRTLLPLQRIPSRWSLISLNCGGWQSAAMRRLKNLQKCATSAHDPVSSTLAAVVVAGLLTWDVWVRLLRVYTYSLVSVSPHDTASVPS